MVKDGRAGVSAGQSPTTSTHRSQEAGEPQADAPICLQHSCAPPQHTQGTRPNCTLGDCHSQLGQPQGLRLEAGEAVIACSGGGGSEQTPGGGVTPLLGWGWGDRQRCRHLPARVQRQKGRGSSSQLTSPFQGSGAAPCLPSFPLLQFHFATSRLQPRQEARGGASSTRPPARAGRTQPLGTQLPHVARRRRGHPQPAPLTWSPLPPGPGGPGPGSLLQLWALASPRPMPSGWGAGTCACGWRHGVEGGGAQLPVPPPPLPCKPTACKMPGLATLALAGAQGGGGAPRGESSMPAWLPGRNARAAPEERWMRWWVGIAEERPVGRGHAGLDPLTQAGPRVS